MFKFKGTAIVVGIFAILLAYIFLIDIKNPTKEEKEEQEKIVLKIENTDKIKSLGIKNDNGEIKCEKKDNSWFIVSPVNVKGDEGLFNGLLASLTELKSEQKTFEGGKNQEEYGLGKPLTALTVNFDDGTTKILSVGKKSFDENSYYATIEGDGKVFLIANYIVDSYLNKTVSDLRDKTVISSNPEEINEFEFKNGDKVIKAKKDENKKWTITSPENSKGDKDIITSWLNTIISLRVKDFSQVTKEEVYGLDKPLMDITVFEGKDNVKKQLIIGSKDEASGCYYVKRGGDKEIFTVDTASIETLKKDSEEFKNKSVFDSPFGDIASFEIKKDKNIISGSKDSSGNWTLSKPENKKATGWKIENQLNNVINLKAEKIVDNKPIDKNKDKDRLRAYGLDNPISVSIVNKDGGKANLLIGNKLLMGEDFYGKREDENTVFIVSKTIIDGLNDLLANPPYEVEKKESK